MKKMIAIVTISTLLLLSGCLNQKVATVEPTVGIKATDIAPMNTKLSSGLTLDEIKNTQVYAPQSQKNVKLTDGKYEAGDGADYALVEVLPQSTLADLNGDGVQDAAVLLAENTGGSGVFVSLVAFLSSENGFSESQAVLIDDRPQINSLSVANGKITIDALIHAENDAMVSPSLRVMESYMIYGDSLSLVGLESTLADSVRRIKVEIPAEEDIVAGNIEVKGSMPIAPFENTLRYRFYDASGKVLEEGAFKVESTDVGKPASFDNLLTPPTAPGGTKLRLELAELSAKDGSPLCLASVDLKVK